MREFKFRAWPISEAENRMLFRGIHDNHWYYTPCNDENGCHAAYPINTNDRIRLKVMQCTGLKDKNGKEIYEDDIVKVHDREIHYDDDEFTIGTVKYMNIYYPAFDIYTVSNRAKSGFEPYNDEYNTFTTEVEIEVIGNIYDNPELLKDT